ncbi:DNA-processing protein DprA [Psychrobacter sp. GP33]|uniref:DNA-processing protein DprA n=1 Tax=Psychrobacter sp. GP33 TaxID=2758709 RepID=UPI0015F95621|nr:DNA-processing protein DprA [Psychrobacter sp. GP33]
MSNSLTEDTKATILLFGVFGKARSEKPLSLREYTSLVRWLVKVDLRPKDLLYKDNVSEASIGANIDHQRLVSLLGRGVQLGFAVEEWQQAGIWIISRSDSDYPTRYKKHLKDKSPPLLFGIGNRSLLNEGGLSIVGSRNVDKVGESFTRHVAQICADNRLPVISGGARGVDQTSMDAVLEAGGKSVGVLADSLLKKSLERSTRHAISDERLLLISPYNPSAGFNVGNAMGRNKLIYALSDYCLVVSADHKKGGTWAGAEEELKRENALPVFVRIGGNVPLGNTKLIEMGAIIWPSHIESSNFKQKLHDSISECGEKPLQQNLSLFESNVSEGITNVEMSFLANESIEVETLVADKKFDRQHESVSIYELVMPVILNELDSPLTSSQLAEVLDINTTQLNIWLKQAVEDQKVVKLFKPVRYQKAKP